MSQGDFTIYSNYVDMHILEMGEQTIWYKPM